MASNTPRLNLYKKDPVADANTTFNITTMLNDNWDRIDQNVALQADLHTHANKAVLDKFSEGADGKPLYNGQKITDETTVQALQKEIANLNLQLEASQRVPNGYTFGTDGVNIFGMNIDFTKTTAVGDLSAGITNIPVQDVTGFKAGQEVTIYDDTNIERVTISGIDPDNKTLSVSSLVNSYKDGANVARTMAVADTINKCLKFGSWSTQTTNTVTDATVVASAYDTSGNGGRKLVRLSNGALIATVKSSSNALIYKSVDNGNTWSLIRTGPTQPSDASIETNGKYIYHLVPSLSNNYVYAQVVDENGNLISTFNLDTGQTALGNCSLTINDAGTELHAAWASKNSTYPNSFNIRYAKGTINADGTVTWGAVEQRTTIDTSGEDYKNPCIIIKSDGKPAIFADRNNGTSTNQIRCFYFNGTVWGSIVVYGFNGYIQSYPSACVDKNGRIWVAWLGTDSTDTTAYNIRVAYSDDGGVTWSSMTKLTSGNTYGQQGASITVNKNSEVYVIWHARDASDAYADILMIKYSSGSWGSITVVSTGTTGSKVYPSTLYDPTLDFSTPLFIYQDLQGSKVGFYGTWTTGSNVPLLENDIRFTVKDTDEVVAWAERDELAGFTINAKLNGQAMTKTSATGEDQFTATLPSVQPAELKLTLTRANTADDVKISKILGGVA